ncbi:MAG: AAA family ATPase [Eubacteriales bacterium]|nr:AAA family ATPase [Eubacteriales bacterium]
MSNLQAQNPAEIYPQEQVYLEEVQAFIRASLTELRARKQALFEESVRQKREGYEEHLEYKLGPDNAVLQSALLENHHQREQVSEEISALERIEASPYFAKLRFEFSDDHEVGSFYIGLRDLLDTAEYRQYVVDWRSPLATLYYEANLGDCAYETAYGCVEGRLLEKLQILIQRGVLKSIVPSEKDLHDELLRAVLSERASATMREIVATLQSEQNEIIRADQAASVFIQGLAGSGKTSVALHRAAYLLYRNANLSSDRILLLSPNHYFSQYVSELLPRLNEAPLRSLTFDDLAIEVLSQREGRYRRLKFREASLERQQEFASAAFYQQFQEFIKRFEEKNFVAFDLQFADVKITKSEIERDFYALKSEPHFKRFENLIQRYRTRFKPSQFVKIQQQLLRSLWSMYQVHRIGAVFQAFEEDKKHADFKLVADGESAPKIAEIFYPETFGAERRKQQRPEQEGVRYLEASERRLVPTAVYQPNKESAQPPYEDLSSGLYRNEGSSGLDRVDLLLRFALYCELYPVYGLEPIQHLIVDEFEELGYLQHACISKLFSCTKTIIGDVYQNLKRSQTLDDFYAITAIYEANRSRGETILIKEFTRAYRCSYEIAQFCAALFPEQDLQALERHGELIEVCLTDHHDAAVEALAKRLMMLEREFKSSDAPMLRALLCADQAMKSELLEALQARSLSIGTQAFTEAQQCTIFTLEEARGMEFDEVLLFELDQASIDDEILRRRLYLGASRALHSVSIFGGPKLAQVLETLSDKCYRITQ